MSNLTSQKKTELQKRYLFLGVTGAGVLSCVFSTIYLGIPLLIWGGYLGWTWFQYRAKRGMRF